MEGVFLVALNPKRVKAVPINFQFSVIIYRYILFLMKICQNYTITADD